MAKFLSILGNIWLILACLVIVAGLISIVIFQGFGKLWDILSPFNMFNWIAVIIILLPGILLKTISNKMQSHGGKENKL